MGLVRYGQGIRRGGALQRRLVHQAPTVSTSTVCSFVVFSFLSHQGMADEPKVLTAIKVTEDCKGAL